MGGYATLAPYVFAPAFDKGADPIVPSQTYSNTPVPCTPLLQPFIHRAGAGLVQVVIKVSSRAAGDAPSEHGD